MQRSPSPGAGEGWTRVAAYCVVEDAGDHLLLCRLSIEELDRTKWTLPGGGIEFGEDPQAAAIRELAEETGLKGHVLELLGIDSRAYKPNAFRDVPLHGIRIVYRVAAQPGELQHEQKGTTDRAEWFSRDQIKALPLADLVPAALAMLDRSRARARVDA